MRLTQFVVAAAALSASALLWAQQSQTGGIIGSLKVNGGMPTERIEVKLEARFTIAAVTYADMEGRFSFMDLPPNLYHVYVDDAAYQPLRVSAVVSSLSAQNVFVQLDLKPVKKADDRKPDETPSGGNPNLVDKDALGKSLPKEAMKAFEKGVKLSGEGKIDDAIEKFEKALEIAPAFYQARNNLGSSYLAKGDFALAQKEFEEVIRMQQADAAAYFNLGNVFLMTNRAEDSYRAIQAGLKREPTSAKGQFLLGTLYSRTGRSADAEKQLQNVLQLDPTISRVHLELANLYIRQNQPDQAIAELSTFLTRFPEDPMANKAKQVLERLKSNSPQPK